MFHSDCKCLPKMHIITFKTFSIVSVSKFVILDSLVVGVAKAEIKAGPENLIKNSDKVQSSCE